MRNRLQMRDQKGFTINLSHFPWEIENAKIDLHYNIETFGDSGIEIEDFELHRGGIEFGEMVDYPHQEGGQIDFNANQIPNEENQL